ncbi:hypothetical protein TTRE_0000180901 [Trichuris trichiura]|uniref:Apple domain-containing protein n=1 Tax=Trichuris trichiura TaxID=36087 RepID=A0A077Z0L5_TRITR|nr:hypothetical protein TTRE_0000180901 [Trichuris trichiura]
MLRAVTILLLSVLSLCPAGILAAKECKGLFHFDLSDKVDNRETFSHRRATSLEECVRICYSKSDFCFSALFIPSPTGSHQCLLSYQAAYMCSKRQLSTVHKLSSKPVIVECIRCTALGDKVLSVSPPEGEAFLQDGLINVTGGMFTQKIETITPDMKLETEPPFQTRPYTKVAIQDGTKTAEQQLESMATSEEHVTTGDVVMFNYGSSTAHLTSPSVDSIQNIEYTEVTTKIVPILEQNEVASTPTAETTSERWRSTIEKLLVTFPTQTDDIRSTDQISTEGQRLATELTPEAATVQEMSSTSFEFPKTTVVSEISTLSSMTTTKPHEGDVSIRQQNPPTDGQPLVTVLTTDVTPTGRQTTEATSKLTTPFSTETTESDQAKKLENILMNEMEFAISGPSETDKVEESTVTFEEQEQKPKVFVTEGAEKVEPLPSTSSDYDYGTTSTIRTGTTHILSVKFEELNYTGGGMINEISGFRQEGTVPLIDFFLPEQEIINETSKGTSMTFAESIERSLAFELDKGQSTSSSGFVETSDNPIEVSEQEVVDSTAAQTSVNPESAKDIDAQKSVTALVGQEESVANAEMSPSKMCPENISFLTNPASSQSGIVYGFEIAANSTEHCAQLCYGKQCSSGVFIKPVISGQLGSCLMAFGEEVCDQTKQRVTSYSGPFPVEISCIRCGIPKKQSIDVKANVATSRIICRRPDAKSDVENLHTATKPLQEISNATIAHRTCLLNVSFEIVEPSFHSKSDFVSHRFATSVAECAKLCYESGCTVAGFTRANVDGEPSFCLLSFKKDTCSGTTRYTHAEPTKEPIQIQCIRCDVTGFEKIQLPSNEEASEFPSTLQPPKNEVSETPGKNEEKKQGCTDTICRQVDAATVSSEKISTVAQIMVPSGKRNCTKRITFQAFQPAENYNVAFTSDHRSSSAADCAKQCYNEGNCQVSAFIAPPKGLSAGVCLLSEEPGFCKTNSEKLVEHSSISPFVISCIACSSKFALLECSFNIRNYIPSVPTAKPATWDSYFDDFEMQVDAKNALECAEKCYSKKCSLAAYSPLTPNGNCLMTIKATRKCDGSDNSDPNVDTSGTLPLLIDCVECA